MKYYSNKSTRWQKALSALVLSVLVFGQAFAQTAGLSATEKELADKITVETIKEITADLSADDMQGRGTMQSGGDRAANWIVDRFQKLGLKPLGDKGSYLQKIDFKESVYTSETTFRLGEENLKLGSEFGIASFSMGNKSLSGDMVFVGYGIVHDGIKRNDLGDMILKDKIAVMLEGPPLGITKEDWEKSNAQQIFTINLIRKGIAGIIFIGHGREQTSVDMLADYFSRRQIRLADEADKTAQYPLFPFVGSKGAEKLFAKADVNLKDALAQAETSAFKPVRLNQKANITSKMKTTKGTSSNVVGYLEGSDATLKAEAVLFSAHYDAYGVENGKIYHGAADNALGVAEMLAVAEAYSKMATKPKRSMVFLAVTGEEYGLLGSKYWSKNPTWDIKKVAANLNLDGIGTEVYAPVKTFVGFGAEHSSLGAILTDVSNVYGIKVIPDPMPDEKIFTRSDHYSFVERGVPALMLLGAPAGEPKAWIERSKQWEKTDYHQPGDTIQPNWAWEGAETVAEVMGIMGLRVSETAAMPAWLSTSRFGKLERGNTKELPEEK
jgi:hypothetical protein